MDDELIDAAWDKNIQRIRDLLARGANPNIHEVDDSFPDVEGDTPLMISSMMKGNFDIVKLFFCLNPIYLGLIIRIYQVNIL